MEERRRREVIRDVDCQKGSRLSVYQTQTEALANTAALQVGTVALGLWTVAMWAGKKALRAWTVSGDRQRGGVRLCIRLICLRSSF